MEDCYRILSVSPSASASEIKRAYRKRAKELHPDIPSPDGTGKEREASRKREEERQERMRELIRAYETLSDPARRSEFDALYGMYRRNVRKDREQFDYRRWLAERTDDESRAKLIFFDLLHDREDDAVREYRLRRSSSLSFSLYGYFGREDFMDCGFIMAEELAFRGDWYEAFRLLAEVIKLERERPYFRHFFPEVLLFARDIARNRLASELDEELALDSLELALELGFGKKDDAVLLRNMAACYERIGDRTMAAKCLEEALRLDSALTGVRDLSRRLAGWASSTAKRRVK